jgi:hypothetical protein
LEIAACFALLKDIIRYFMYITLVIKLFKTGEMVWIWKEAVMVIAEVMPRNLAGCTAGSHRHPDLM